MIVKFEEVLDLIYRKYFAQQFIWSNSYNSLTVFQEMKGPNIKQIGLLKAGRE